MKNIILSILTILFVFCFSAQFDSIQAATSGSIGQLGDLMATLSNEGTSQFFKNFEKHEVATESWCKDCINDCSFCPKDCWPANAECNTCKANGTTCPSKCNNCSHCDSCLSKYSSLDLKKGWCCKHCHPKPPTCQCTDESTCTCETVGNTITCSSK